MRRGHKRKWPERFTIHVKRSEKPTIGSSLELHENIDDFTAQEISLDDHPSPMLAPNLIPAGIWFRRPMDDTDFRLASLNIATPPDFWQRARRVAGKGNKVLLGGGRKLRDDDFGRFLAKIAHSHAVASIGPGSFEPVLINAIRDLRPMYLSHYVGAALNGNTPVLPTEHLHTLQIGQVQFDETGERIVCVRVRLFAVYGFPAYDIAVGAATDTTPPL
ncbi:hypothetical protein [Bradyrhizobium brasilense]|uniref:hypothetical protein n=1 Tax=Bradyrhizobium brasilense TaxID=1419277 RepID=UPI001E286CE2|nr:hypothetical protein [Bradyrhizobium brasilense]